MSYYSLGANNNALSTNLVLHKHIFIAFASSRTSVLFGHDYIGPKRCGNLGSTFVNK